MSRFATPFVLGYHGCERELGMKAIGGSLSLIRGNDAYHWLGNGIYFWESDSIRALEWANEKAARNQLSDPFVIGAVIDLGNCLDLQARENLLLLKSAYEGFLALQTATGLPMPKNRKARRDQRDDKVLRFLDCAVINHLHSLVKTPFDTVRGIFVEGKEIYPGSGFYERTHSEIAVCNPACIKALFLPPQGP